MADPQALCSHSQRCCFPPRSSTNDAAVAKAMASDVVTAVASLHKQTKKRSRNMSLARIQRELKEVERDPPPFCWVGLKDPTTAATHKRRRLEQDNDAEMIMNKTKTDAYTKWVDSHHHWEVMLNGPEDTPYEGGIFFLDILLPERYPFEAPQIKFTTPIYHCNVRSSDGHICLDLLNLEEWRPALSVSAVLLSVVSLLMDPEGMISSDDTVSDKERLELFARDRAKYLEKARDWTRKYAM